MLNPPAKINNSPLRGLTSLIRGIALFYTNPQWWRYALLPVLAILGLFSALYYVISRTLAGHLPESSAFVTHIILIGLTVLALWFTFSTIYMLLGGLFFDPLSERVRHDLTAKPSAMPPFLKACAWSIPGIGLGCLSAILALPLFLLAFIPFVGWIIWWSIAGWFFGTSYLFSAGLAQGKPNTEIIAYAIRHVVTVMLFGAAGIFLFCIPILGIFVIPGLVVGAVLLVEEL